MSINWWRPLSTERDVGVVVVAGGHGQRFGAGIPKQYLPLDGVPVLVRSLRPFLIHPAVVEVVLVLPPADAETPPPWIAALVGGPLRLAAGGPSRTASVRHGVAALSPAARQVLIHDAARPLVSRGVIDAVLTQVRRGTGAVPVVPVTDTLKRADPVGRVTDTLPRAGLLRAQTPQGMPRELLDRALTSATDSVEITDDAMLLEQCGEPVVIVPGDPRNLKITTPEDLLLAEWYLGRP